MSRIDEEFVGNLEKPLTVLSHVCYTLANTETTEYVKALKGRVTVPGCMQRASSWWKARMSTPVNKNLELREEIA